MYMSQSAAMSAGSIPASMALGLQGMVQNNNQYAAPLSMEPMVSSSTSIVQIGRALGSLTQCNIGLGW